jgi:hypothetical protein
MCDKNAASRWANNASVAVRRGLNLPRLSTRQRIGVPPEAFPPEGTINRPTGTDSPSIVPRQQLPDRDAFLTVASRDGAVFLSATSS